MNIKRIIPSCITIVLLGSAFVSTFCTSKIDCPSVDNPIFFSWFPYTKGQVVIFKNTAGNTDSIRIDSIVKTEAYSETYHSSWSSKPPVCSTKIEMGGWQMHIKYSSEDYLATTILWLKNQSFPARDITDTGFRAISYWQSQSYFGYNLSGVFYDTVQKIYTIDTAFAAGGGIDTIFIAKGHGIIGYTTYPALETWSVR